MGQPWKVVALAAEASTDEGWRGPVCDCGTVVDPDGTPIPHGEPLWPERWPCAALAQFKYADATVWETSYQLRPTLGGGFWFAASPPQFYEDTKSTTMNIYLLCDSSLGRTKTSDRTTIGAVGLGADRNFYLLDLAWGRFSIDERAGHLFRMQRKWKPLAVGYEEYGLQIDTIELAQRMEREGSRFLITPLGRGGTWHNMSKSDRISTMVPQAQQGRWWLPNPETKGRDPLVAEWVRRVIDEEWNRYPACKHDDVLDMLSRINDPGPETTEARIAGWPPRFPAVVEETETARPRMPGTTWMSL